MKKYTSLFYLLTCILSANAQIADKIAVLNDQTTNPAPSSFSQEVRFHFKWNSSIGVPHIGSPGAGTYSALMTIAPWSDGTASKHHQLNFNEEGLFWRKGLFGSSWESWKKIVVAEPNGNVGIGINIPLAKLHVHDDTPLPQATGSNQLLSRISGRGYNYFMESHWLLRDDNTTTGWTTTRMHNGISIDGSFLQPGVDTRTWWERDPYNNIQSWGQANQTYMTINNGNVGIGTINPDAKLAVKGTIHAEEVKVDLNVPVPDYVFEKNYNLLTLAEVENYINQNKHLPEVPAAKEMEENGVNLGEMNMLLLKKVEELTLYVIELKKENESQRRLQQAEIESIKNSLNKN